MTLGLGTVRRTVGPSPLEPFSSLKRLVALWETILPSRQALVGLPPATRYLIVGLAGLIGLVAAITVSAIIAVELSASSHPAWFGSGPFSESTARSRKDKTYEHVVERPLFSRNRQGSVAVADSPIAAVAPAPPALDQGIILRGVYINGISAKAFLTSPQNPVGSWVNVNGEISGWRLVDVKPQQVMLEGQGEKLALKLNVLAR